jgi:hypothetical protein
MAAYGEYIMWELDFVYGEAISTYGSYKLSPGRTSLSWTTRSCAWRPRLQHITHSMNY